MFRTGSLKFADEKKHLHEVINIRHSLLVVHSWRGLRTVHIPDVPGGGNLSESQGNEQGLDKIYRKLSKSQVDKQG